MKETDKSFTALQLPQATGIQHVQQSFARYQASAFPPRTPSFFALELAGECGELANLEKKVWRDPTLFETYMDEIGFEAADIFIALMKYSNSRQINLEEMVEKKLHTIEKRRLEGKMGPIP